MAVTVTQSQLTLTSGRDRFRNPPWWNRRSRLERILCGVSGVCLLMCTAMAVALAVIGYHYQIMKSGSNSEVSLPGTSDKLVYTLYNSIVPPKPAGICLTPGCVKAAASILNNINDAVEPCENFYEFACGGWLKKQLIPDDRSSVSVFSLLQDDLDLKLRAMVETGIKDTDSQYIQNLKSMYDACMNTTHIEMMGNEPLENVIKEIGSWPAVVGEKWNNATFDWMDALFALRRVGFGHNILLSVSIGPDIRNNTRHVIDLDQASLGMPDRNYLLKGMDDPLVAAYYQLMVDSAVLLGANKTTAQKEMKDALNFEIAIANFSVPREERRNISRLYNKMTVNDLYKLAPDINWEKYFNRLLMDKISRSEEVIVIVPDYVQNLQNLLKATDKRVIANYLMWRVVGQAFPTLHRAWGEISQHYSSILTGKVRQEARWEHCLGTLSGSLSTALASLYVRHHFKDGSKDLALEMVNYIHREFLHILSKVDWMDQQTKQRAKEKAQNMATYIGYPNELLEEWKVSEIYDGLHINSSSYFENVRTLRKWATDYVLSKLRKQNVKGDWKKRSAAAVVNAFYNSIENSIEFPAGILQGVFFNKDRPNYLNFGAIGFVIGHEITHGFDDRGRQFDKDGNNINWWEPETDSTFRERAQCIVDQYGNYSVDEVGLQVNGINTQGENIADNGGIKEAFRAYLQWIRDHGAEDYLPGIKYSPTQLFWISAANVWCGKYRPEVLKLRIMTGSHSPAPYRVIGPLANAPEFAKEFGCPLGSPMNPIRKCTVW
ncbi:neprilysin-2-like [Uloborus diversus]|uniref:neprilysin-2-like n=1 Tax=Uloborus diversus TaxID=327109 RepID=UPI002409E007|nr:neprilysin-2-like [Uloborus diversus]